MPRTFKELSELIVGLRQVAEGIRKHDGESWNPEIGMADDFDNKALGLSMLIPQIIDLENETKLKTKELDGYLDAILDGIGQLKGFIEQKCISTGEVSEDVFERFNVPIKIINPTQAEIIIWGRTLMTTFPEIDASPYAPPAAIKTMISDNSPNAETAQEDGRNMAAELTNLTQDKDALADDAVEKRELLRNSLTRMLPEKRYDKRLDDYGFDVWNKPGEGGGGDENGWQNKPTAEIKKITFPKLGITAGCAEYTGTDRFDIRIAYAPKGAGVPSMPDYDYVTDVEEPVFLDVELMNGYVYYEWIRARKGEEVSEWSDVASLEWNG